MSNFETVAVIPAYNEAATIEPVVRAALRAESVDLVLVVDDGSEDKTADVATMATFVEEGNLEVLSHGYNRGKTEALMTGVTRAEDIAVRGLKHLLFLDADSSPVWSRGTPDNMKLWQAALRRIAPEAFETPDERIMAGREDAFITLLARYIDEMVEPVATGRDHMRIGMYKRNIITDTLMQAAQWGGFGGNRAVRYRDWRWIFMRARSSGVDISGWDIEAVMNQVVARDKTSAFLMHGVVNVGSRVKTGSLVRGGARMASIHGRALYAGLRHRGEDRTTPEY